MEQIREILNDDDLDDPECFYKIDSIVSAFHSYGLDISRHDYG